MRTDSQPNRPAGRAVPGHGVHGQSLSSANHRLRFRPRQSSRLPTPKASSIATTCPATWSSRLVGDLNPDEVFPIVERYFGQIPAKTKPPEITHDRAAAKFRSRRSRCRIPHSRSTSRAITGPAIWRRMTWSTTQSPTFFPTGARLGSIARWCATNRFRLMRQASPDFPEASIRICSPSMRFQFPDTPQTNCKKPSRKRSKS